MQCNAARRYAKAGLPRDMVLSASLDAASFDFVWVPEAPAEEPELPCEPPKPLPLVQRGRAKSPVWPHNPPSSTDIRAKEDSTIAAGEDKR
jgi:hypothetical protein